MRRRTPDIVIQLSLKNRCSECFGFLLKNNKGDVASEICYSAKLKVLSGMELEG